MTGTFKANNPINSFLLLAYGLLIKLPIFLYPQVPHAAEADGFFYRYLLNWLDNAGSAFPVIYSICAFILLYVQAMGINKLVNAQKLLPKPNYLPAMCYLLITSLFREWQILSAQLIMATLLVWILSQLSNLYNHSNAKTILFNTGMALGVATFFYFPGIAFTLLLVVGLSVTRPFKLPEWVVALLGMLAPAYFYGAWIFLTGQWESFKLPVVNMSSGGFHQTSWGYISIAIILLAVVIGSVFIQQSISRLLVQSRKCWSLVYLYLLVALLMPLLTASFGPGSWFLSLVPVAAVMAASLFYPDRKWFAHLIHWGLFILTIVQGYFIR